MVKSSTEQG